MDDDDAQFLVVELAAEAGVVRKLPQILPPSQIAPIAEGAPPPLDIQSSRSAARLLRRQSATPPDHGRPVIYFEKLPWEELEGSEDAMRFLVALGLSADSFSS